MTIGKGIAEDIQRASWIRRMFETGRALKKRVGAENVCDFSLGNPLLEPPAEFQQALRELTHDPPPGVHRYMPNAGFLSTRQAVADHLSRQEDLEIHADDVVMTVGAAGAIHVALTAALDVGDEVIVLAPYFVEYGFYIRLSMGTMKLVETTEDFDIDLEALEAAIGPKTKVIIINTPNNPTGRIYSAEKMRQLAELLARKQKSLNRTLYLITDTPYARLTFDGHRNPPLLRDHPNSFIAHSHSKDLGLAGERIGYLAISPRAEYRQEIRDATSFANRVLGFINAPALMQLALERSINATVDISVYQKLRDRLAEGLRDAGYQFTLPQGSFYLFPKTPIADDIEFTDLLRKENVLVVPGSGFGRAGYMRIAFCVSMETVERAIPLFARVMKQVT